MDPSVIEILLGRRCNPRCNVQKLTKTGRAIVLTSNGSRRQRHGLKPHREEVHDGEVAKGDQEITHSYEDRNFLFEQIRCQHGLDGEFQFDDEEEEEKYDGDYESRDDSCVIPLFGF